MIRPVNIEFILPGSDIHLYLEAQLVSIRNRILHAKIVHIDIDSMTHLRRLIELNVGDDELLHRELEQLADLGQHSE